MTSRSLEAHLFFCPRPAATDGNDLEIARIFSGVQDDLRRVEELIEETARVEFPPLAYALNLALFPAGKRLRPALALLAARFGRYDQDKLVAIATSIELLHSATLVHDDTIDHSTLRRGNPTLNSVLSNGATILVGDYLFAQSAAYGAKPKSPRITAILAQVLVDICDGELRQLFSARRWQQSLDEYHYRIYCKTAALFAGSTELGAIISQVSEEEIAALRQYGLKLGMAFQVVDDIFDIQSQSSQIGKPVGSDLRQGTVTLPTILFLENKLIDQPAKSKVIEVIEGRADREEDIQAALQLIVDRGMVEAAQQEASNFVREAKEALQIFPDNEDRRNLIELADYIVERNK
jgi:geranylgeranyl pyrophosphate synthase